ncbi:UDP-2,3-diacylglucosamine diphosphatase [Sulfurovum sp.]|jgi:UDP-2,3-diacylglucosamine pyrophosphatase LpxH|uniref:UDP-2,3-diacylglucosamine diphosphatase n=1 Tax=Sulfurovum sp. TaxID=1969726 RepID=UPI002A36F361|nr:UDP-2,3-diacylglucosamine diphosphatase [Sulfurovum sp.]MDY0403733.1 UDP-2,3-diacylglucosamine diphosphatase [Sulfurovum sp.]
MKYRSIFVSDIHLGTKFSQADAFLEFMKHYESENLYMVGDIIDGWALKRKFRWNQAHSDVVQKILRKARKGTNVYLVTGNHDEFLRPFLPLMLGDNLEVDDAFEYVSVEGKKYFVTHGDIFDSITLTKKWLAVLGDYGYEVLLNLNHFLHFFRQRMGIKRYWSLSKYVKDNVKKSVSFITDFEEILSQHAKHKGYDGIICGHIHKAEMKMIDGIEYKNSGDWVESCTALVETLDGEWKVIHWHENEKH